MKNLKGPTISEGGGEGGGYGSLRTADAFSVVVSLPPNFRRERSDNWKCIVVRRLGLWVISEKNILQTDFKGKIILQGTIWEKNFSDEKKNLSWHIMLVRKILHRCMSRGLGEKNSYTNQITLT